MDHELQSSYSKTARGKTRQKLRWVAIRKQIIDGNIINTS